MKDQATAGTAAGDTGEPLTDEAQTLIDDAMEQAGDSPEQIAENEEIEQAGPTIPTAELLAPVVGLLCAVAVPNWEINPDEQKALCESYSQLIDKYFPGGLDLGVEFGALMVTAAIFLPRMGKPAKVSVIEGDQDGADDGKA